MDKDELLKLDSQICFPMYVASRMITRAYQPLLDDLGITYPQYLVLMVLWEQDGMLVNDIAQRLYLNTNTITPLLKRMEKSGIVARNRSQEDERKVVIQLTQKGHEMKSAAHCVPEEIFKKMGFDLDEFQQLKGVLSKLINHMEKP